MKRLVISQGNLGVGMLQGKVAIVTGAGGDGLFCTQEAGASEQQYQSLSTAPFGQSGRATPHGCHFGVM